MQMNPISKLTLGLILLSSGLYNGLWRFDCIKTGLCLMFIVIYISCCLLCGAWFWSLRKSCEKLGGFFLVSWRTSQQRQTLASGFTILSPCSPDWRPDIFSLVTHFSLLSVLKRFLLIGVLHALLCVVLFCSFLRKLYDSSEECPRSYDKLHFNPRYLPLFSSLRSSSCLILRISL